MGLTILELAMFLIMLERMPKVSRRHVRALLCILRDKSSYQSLEEIEKSTLLKNQEAQRIMNAFAKNELVQKDGCLYRKQESEKIAGMI